jgi:hypothetical protein
MRRRTKAALRGSGLILAIVLLNCLPPNFGCGEAQEIQAQTPEHVGPLNEVDYVGWTKCAACHYKQYEDWKSDPHAKAFDYFPEKYLNNAECLQCHTSRHGPSQAGEALTNDLPGVRCEDCHGPGRDHANLALTFVGQSQYKELTEEAVEMLRSRIQRVALGQCVKCHTSKGHKPHPKFDRDAPVKLPQQPNTSPRRGFFDVHSE